MQIKQLLQDDQGVSPVIGVILMVAITVILAAVIGTFVLGLGGNLSKSAPTASFQFDYTADSSSSAEGSLTIAHAGGDTIPASSLYIKGSETFYLDKDANAAGSDNSAQLSNSALLGDVEVSAGDTVTIYEDGSTEDPTKDFDDATFRIVWQSAEGDSSATLGKWSGPNAS